MSTKSLYEPAIKGYDEFEAPSFSFLVEHPSGRKVLFDLGVRKDFHQNSAPAWLNMVQAGMMKVDAEKNIREILEEHGVRGSDIEAIIWSHWHFDQ